MRISFPIQVLAEVFAAAEPAALFPLLPAVLQAPAEAQAQLALAHLSNPQLEAKIVLPLLANSDALAPEALVTAARRGNPEVISAVLDKVPEEAGELLLAPCSYNPHHTVWKNILIDDKMGFDRTKNQPSGGVFLLAQRFPQLARLHPDPFSLVDGISWESAAALFGAGLDPRAEKDGKTVWQLICEQCDPGPTLLESFLLSCQTFKQDAELGALLDLIRKLEKGIEPLGLSSSVAHWKTLKTTPGAEVFASIAHHQGYDVNLAQWGEALELCTSQAEEDVVLWAMLNNYSTFANPNTEMCLWSKLEEKELMDFSEEAVERLQQAGLKLEEDGPQTGWKRLLGRCKDTEVFEKVAQLMLRPEPVGGFNPEGFEEGTLTTLERPILCQKPGGELSHNAQKVLAMSLVYTSGSGIYQVGQRLSSHIFSVLPQDFDFSSLALPVQKALGEFFPEEIEARRTIQHAAALQATPAAPSRKRSL